MNEAKVIRTERTSLKDRQILYVEDNPDNQFLIRRYLEAAGAEVTIASDGQEGVQLAETLCPDIILMDIHMPQMDGLQATQAIRKHGYRKPIIALTAHLVGQSRKESLEAGCDECLRKPIVGQTLVKTLERYLSDERAPVFSEHRNDPRISGVLDYFVGVLPQRVASMKDFYSKKNFTELNRLAHQLKGASGGYGYPDLAKLAARMEDRTRTGTEPNLDLDFSKIELHVQRILWGHEKSKTETTHWGTAPSN